MNVGGPAIQITGLMQGMRKEQFEQLLLTGQCSRDEIDFLEEHAIQLNLNKLDGLGRHISLISDLTVFFKIRNLINSFKPHIVHTHTAKAGVLGRLAALSVSRKIYIIHTFHGHLLHGYFGRFKTKIVVLIERILAHFSDALIAVGNKVKDDLLDARIGRAEQYSVIGPGLSLETLPSRKNSKASLSIPESTFVISWIGRVVPIKAPHRIIEIASECVKRELNVQFLVAGGGPLLATITNDSKKLGLPINFLGWQSDIEPVLSASNLVMLTSENEGTPISLIQAQMAGIPVLTTDVGSAREVLLPGVSGFCLEYSVKAFADKIELLQKDSDLEREMGACASEMANTNFSLERMIRDHEYLYTSLISRSNF
jgi:glycosyltransferase involved in cell wall biosynthesis